SGPWHLKQCAARIGRTFAVNSSASGVAAGNRAANNSGNDIARSNSSISLQILYQMIRVVVIGGRPAYNWPVWRNDKFCPVRNRHEIRTAAGARRRAGRAERG